VPGNLFFFLKIFAMTRLFLFKILCLILLLSTVSCVSGQQTKSNEFENSKVYPVVACAADTNLTYALFLPPQYTKGKPCPLLILFDPHGSGLLPVNQMNAEAAKNGFILAGSNNSKNGMDFEQTTDIYRKMLADLESRFTIETKAVYLCGFSGGSRVAGAVAITEGGVAGVVGCGAGLPAINRNPSDPFSYLAVVGNQDFNYTEIKQLDEMLESAHYQHHLLVFDGIHQWPPKELLPDIFTWLRFDAMRQQAIPTDWNEINRFIEKNDKIAGDLATEQKFPAQQAVYIKMLHYLQGLTDVAPLQAEINRLSSEKEVIAYQKQQQKLLDLEQELQQKYSPELNLKNVDWWKKEAALLQSLTKQSRKPEINQVYQRVLAFLSMNCYMYANDALKRGNLVSAEKYIEIYRLVDPTNNEHRYMAAKVAALNHNSDTVFSSLNQAFDLGFKDINRLKSDPDFKPYLEDDRFKSFISNK
jgi:poly(3-hydroxybutyrate) depolymerase